MVVHVESSDLQRYGELQVTHRIYAFALASLAGCALRHDAAQPISSTHLPFPSLPAEAREILNQLVAVDTSHGNESEALRPLAARFAAVGLASEIIESSPGRGNLVVRIKGDGSKRPLLLLAHIDVVPVDGQPWTVPPFAATEKDGFLWARGVSDDKAMGAACIAIMIDAARNKTPRSRDLILALTAGEETGGDAGIGHLLSKHKSLVGDAEIALNEGGGILLDEALAKVQAVTIGTAEKSYQSFRFSVKGKGGHSSLPPTDHDPAAILARAIVKIADHRFRAHVLSDVGESLRQAAGFETPPMSAALLRVAGSAPTVHEGDEAVLSRDRMYNALIRTTCVTTMLKGSPKDNVLPTSAEATVNCRILPDETRDETQQVLIKVVDDARVEIAPDGDLHVGPSSPIDGDVRRAVEKVTHTKWPAAAVYPSMGTGATDSRHLRNAGILAYGISAAATSIAEGRRGHGAHGPDERLPTKWLGEGALFLRDVVVELTK